jgi:predicted oxidoreductase
VSKAAARRWFEARDGQTVTTLQVRPSGITWDPGPRVVEMFGRKIRLDGSTVQFGPDHVVLEVTESSVRVEWQDDDGTAIHTTTYRDY